MTLCPPWVGGEAEHERVPLIALFERLEKSVHARCRARIPDAQVLRDWHQAAFASLVPVHYYAGNFRQWDPSRPCLAENVHVGGVDASDYGVVDAQVRNLERWIATEVSALELRWDFISPATRLQRVARIVGTAVGRLIQIHPFLNGNGRSSRLLWNALLARLGFPRQMAVLFHPPMPQYDEVMAYAMRGNFAPATAMVIVGLSRVPVPTLG